MREEEMAVVVIKGLEVQAGAILVATTQPN